MKVFLEKTGKYISIKHYDTIQGRSHALKVHLSRNKIDHMLYMNEMGFKETICNFCGNPSYNFGFNTKIIDNKLIVDGINYNGLRYYCYGKGCPGKLLNSNSVKFVDKAYNINNEEESLKFIHERNSSLFYAENHKSLKDYTKYQGSRLDDKTEEEYQAIIDKQNHSRSLEGYIEKYGKHDGEVKWNLIQKQKGITLENLIRKHGSIDAAKIKLQEWKDSVGPSLKNFQRRYGNDIGLNKYRSFHENNARTHTNAFGNISYTEIGETLRSNHERRFYKAMLNCNLHYYNYEIEKYYNDSVQRSDFYFTDLDLHIEIVGLMDIEEYKVKMELKEQNFGALLLAPNEDYVTICKQIRKSIDELYQS